MCKRVEGGGHGFTNDKRGHWCLLDRDEDRDFRKYFRDEVFKRNEDDVLIAKERRDDLSG